MTAILAWITAKVGGLLGVILGALLREVWQIVVSMIQKARDAKAAQQAAKDSVQPLKDAKTEKEIDEAAQSSIDNL